LRGHRGHGGGGVDGGEGSVGVVGGANAGSRADALVGHCVSRAKADGGGSCLGDYDSERSGQVSFQRPMLNDTGLLTSGSR
jgi:hypothetical protein